MDRNTVARLSYSEHKFDRLTAESETSSSFGNSTSPDKDLHEGWAAAAFESFGASKQCLGINRIQGRAFGIWFRAFITDMVVVGQMNPVKRVSTKCLIDLLLAKAELNDNNCLSLQEFQACTRVVSHPSPGSTLEAEFVWSLFDLQRSGEIALDKFLIVRNTWAAVGMTCSDEDFDAAYMKAEEEGTGSLSAEMYHNWLTTRCSRAPKRVPLSARSNGSAKVQNQTSSETTDRQPTNRLPGLVRRNIRQTGGDACAKHSCDESPEECALDHGCIHHQTQRPNFVFSIPAKPKDQVLRSSEIASASLFQKPLYIHAQMLRECTPMWAGHRKLPGAAGRQQSLGEQVPKTQPPPSA